MVDTRVEVMEMRAGIVGLEMEDNRWRRKIKSWRWRIGRWMRRRCRIEGFQGER